MTVNSHYIRAAGIGVSNPALSKKFYVESVGLQFRSHEHTSIGEDDVLADARGNVLLLTSYAREHSYKKNPVKVVFAVPDVDAFYAQLLAGGGRKHTPPQKFGDMYLTMAFDPDGYVVEGIQMPSVGIPTFVALGIGVSNLDTAADYYTRVLGMTFVRDIAVPGYMNEKELAPPKHKRGPSLVLMHYEDQTRSYANIPTRLVLSVDDAATLAATIGRDDPSKVVQAPKAQEGGLVSGLLRDHDGYLVELRQADAGTAAP